MTELATIVMELPAKMELPSKMMELATIVVMELPAKMILLELHLEMVLLHLETELRLGTELLLEMTPLLEANKALSSALLSLLLFLSQLDSAFGKISKKPKMQPKADVLMMLIKSSSIKNFHPEDQKVSICQLTTTHFENLMHKFKSFNIET